MDTFGYRTTCQVPYDDDYNDIGNHIDDVNNDHSNDVNDAIS